MSSCESLFQVDGEATVLSGLTRRSGSALEMCKTQRLARTTVGMLLW